MYRFYMTTEDGNVLVWTHLSRTQAETMNKLASLNFNHLHSSTSVVRYGWEEMARD